jgi:ArsR family transcriptional regulator, arsenate/arsenite/antimonite-responsive transcriptional repressor
VTSLIQHIPRSPKQAIRRRAKLDKLLDPQVLRVLAEPVRASLLSCLLKCGRPCSVTEVAECCEVDFSMVARHLGLMARAGLLRAEKRGRTVWYTARGTELAGMFRELAAAIDELACASACCADPGSCGCADGPEKRPERGNPGGGGPR